MAVCGSLNSSPSVMGSHIYIVNQSPPANTVSTLLISTNFLSASCSTDLSGLAGWFSLFGALFFPGLLTPCLGHRVRAKRCYATDLTVLDIDTSNSSGIKRILLVIKFFFQLPFLFFADVIKAFQLQGSQVSEMNNEHHHHYFIFLYR